jgi:putative acetyltransferase
MPTIVPATSPDTIATIRTLLRDYQMLVGVDLCFQGFEAELRDLPGGYAPPRGRLLLAMHDGRDVGCVALRDVGAGRCEMKRLFVRPDARGLGLGGALVAEVMREARAIGYEEMVLDTLPSMVEAQRMYERLGFRDVAAYCENPVVGARYRGLRLGSAPPA